MTEKKAVNFITNRDREVLSFIGRGGIASLDQLHRRFWPAASKQTCRARLLKLEKSWLVTSYYMDARKYGTAVLCFSITTTGASLFTAGERERMIIGPPAGHEIKQQLLAQTARIQFEQKLLSQGSKLLDWINERELRRRQSRSIRNHCLHYEIADCQAVIENQQGSRTIFDIEIDGYYYGQMLREKISWLAELDNPVIYVVEKGRAAAVSSLVVDSPNIDLLILEE